MTKFPVHAEDLFQNYGRFERNYKGLKSKYHTWEVEWSEHLFPLKLYTPEGNSNFIFHILKLMTSSDIKINKWQIPDARPSHAHLS